MRATSIFWGFPKTGEVIQPRLLKPAMEGMIVDENFLVQIVTPGKGNLVPKRELGEVSGSTLNPDYPLIRYEKGDLSAVLLG